MASKNKLFLFASFKALRVQFSIFCLLDAESEQEPFPVPVSPSHPEMQPPQFKIQDFPLHLVNGEKMKEKINSDIA